MKRLLILLVARFVSFDTRMRLEGGVCDVEIDGINRSDYPDFCDAYISSATWKVSLEYLSESELEQINDDSCLVHGLVWDRVF